MQKQKNCWMTRFRNPSRPKNEEWSTFNNTPPGKEVTCVKYMKTFDTSWKTSWSFSDSVTGWLLYQAWYKGRKRELGKTWLNKLAAKTPLQLTTNRGVRYFCRSTENLRKRDAMSGLRQIHFSGEDCSVVSVDEKDNTLKGWTYKG